LSDWVIGPLKKRPQFRGTAVKFSEIIDQACTLLQRKGRLTYRSLKLEFALDDEQLDVLKEELITGQQLAVDEDGKVLVWTGDRAKGEKDKRIKGEDSPEFRRFLRMKIPIQVALTGRMRIAHLGNRGLRSKRASTACLAVLLSVTPFA